MNISNATVVAIDYTLTNDQGEVLDTSDGREPLVYLHGASSIIPGLEQALEGKEQGEELAVRVPPEDAYGVRDESMIQAVPKAMFGDNPVQVGARYRAAGPNGEPLEITVVEADEERVTLDANHPLAGEHLNFEVKVREVRPASEEEVAHGHAHGPEGHQHD